MPVYDVLEGIKVLEVAEWTFVPAAGTVLADWGAEVIKVEHPVTGDPQRGLINKLSAAGSLNPMFEVGNRGKRSIGIDLTVPEGRDVLMRLVDECDVFLTSMMRDARRKLGIETDAIMARNPTVIYGRGTGQGLVGPDADKGGYDWASTWCRTGIAHRMTPPGGEPPFMPGSIGDLTGGVTLAGAIAAALVRRFRTGVGAVVDNSLYSVGAWIMCQSVVAAPFGVKAPYVTTRDPLNPLVNMYRTSDDRWICLCLLQADRWWIDFCKHIDRVDLIDDPRYNSIAARDENRDACIAELDETFARRTFAEWRTRLDTMEGVWAPLLSAAEVCQDPQALLNGFVTDISMGDGESYLGSASPGQFDERPVGELTAAPAHGQHTEEVLLELGLDWDEIGSLKEKGAVL
jgi:crotonobetainyl-CoA:carnitine CoA-transferase CaiB-like acyl-CoA transferase